MFGAKKEDVRRKWLDAIRMAKLVASYCSNCIQWYTIPKMYSVSQKKIPPPYGFLDFFPNGWEFLINFLHAYYTILSPLDYKFFSTLFNFDKVMPY